MKPFFNSVEELQAACDSYFDLCDEGELIQVANRGTVVDVKRAIPYTVPGLALHLGYAKRQSVWDLKQNPAYSDTIQRALTRIENQRVRKALNGEQNERFAQFDLKNNFGYKDAQEITQVTLIGQLTDDQLDQRIELIERKLGRLASPAAQIPEQTSQESIPVNQENRGENQSSLFD